MSFSTIRRAAMANFSPKSQTHYPFRSISLPARSHPTTIRIEEELTKLKTLKPSSSKSETICNSLSGLGELYKSIKELLALPLTKKSLENQQEKWLDELLELSIRYIDICSNTRDGVMQMKEHIRQLKSALRRSKSGDLGIESKISAYIRSRKMIKKEISRSLTNLKHIDIKFGDIPSSDSDQRLSALLRVLTEASIISSSIFQSLLLFLSESVLKLRPSRWSMVSKLVHNGLGGFERNTMNKVVNVEIALRNLLFHDLSKEAEMVQSAEKSLDGLDDGMEGLENGLEFLFRHFINMRVSLLNILSK